MDYLVSQIWLYMAITFLLGLLLGWLIWRYSSVNSDEYDQLVRERDALRTERDGMATEKKALLEERDALNTNLDASRNRAAKERDAAEDLRGENARLTSELEACRSEVAAAAVAAPVMAAAVETNADVDLGADVGTKPQGLDGPRGGMADDLKEINGIGPKLEKLLHSLGYFHFDQVAAWTAEELAWVDHNLEGFKGRATRDEWVKQAKEFARR